MVDVTPILVTAETLRVRNPGWYRAPHGIYGTGGERSFDIRNQDPVNAKDSTVRSMAFTFEERATNRQRLTLRTVLLLPFPRLPFAWLNRFRYF